MVEMLMLLIIALVIYTFILLFVIKSAIDNSKAIQNIESLLEQLVNKPAKKTD